MGKYCNPTVIDAALNYVKNNVNVETVCSQQPTTRAEAITTYKLAAVTIDDTDITLANGDVSGRKGTVAEQDGVTVDDTGEGNHIALCSASALLYVTTCTPQQLTAGNAIKIPVWDFEIEDPV